VIPLRDVLLATCLVVGLLVSACGDPGPQGRQIVGQGWDTVLTIGSASIEDTVLIGPASVVVWNGLLAVLEDQPQRVRAFSLTGDDRWAFGSAGQGPGEMLQAFSLIESPNGNLGIADGRNRKLVEVDSAGQFMGERYYRHLPGASDNPTYFGDRLIWSQYMPDRPLFVTDNEGLEVIDSVAIPWPLPADQKYRPNLSTWNAGSADRWVAALWVGPYFAVGDGETVAVFPMVEPFHWSYAPTPQVQQDPMADSAYYGARDVALVEDEIYILGGGRPKRHAHDGEPSRMIDVYGVGGEYRRSYELPFASRSFDTDDGSVFYVLTDVDDIYPHVFGLRVKEN
jgi:hypothetical protein